MRGQHELVRCAGARDRGTMAWVAFQGTARLSRWPTAPFLGGTGDGNRRSRIGAASAAGGLLEEGPRDICFDSCASSCPTHPDQGSNTRWQKIKCTISTLRLVRSARHTRKPSKQLQVPPPGNLYPWWSFSRPAQNCEGADTIQGEPMPGGRGGCVGMTFLWATSEAAATETLYDHTAGALLACKSLFSIAEGLSLGMEEMKEGMKGGS